MAGSDIEPANSSSGEEESSSSENTSTPPPSPHKTQSSSDESDSKNLRSTGKRPAEEADGGEVKRMKTVVAVAAPDADNSVEKRQLFQRLWSEDNEIELIQGMIDYVEAKGKDPLLYVNEFHEFVKKSLHVDVNDRQVLTKARRLKKKFENNAARVENKGKVRSFSNPHEKKMYELSKNLWGNGSNNNVVMSGSSKKVKVKVNVTPKTNKSHKPVGSGNGNLRNEMNAVVAEPKVVRLDHLGSMGLPITDEFIMSKGLELVSGLKRVEIEEKWNNLKVLELEHFVKKLDVLKEQAEIVLNVIAKSGAK